MAVPHPLHRLLLDLRPCRHRLSRARCLGYDQRAHGRERYRLQLPFAHRNRSVSPFSPRPDSRVRERRRDGWRSSSAIVAQ